MRACLSFLIGLFQEEYLGKYMTVSGKSRLDMIYRVTLKAIQGAFAALIISASLGVHAWADPAQATITCKDGTEVQATRSGSAFVESDYEKACKSHGGHNSSGLSDDQEKAKTDAESTTNDTNTITTGATSTAGGDGKDCDATFLGIPAWYRGMQDDSCAFKAPETNGQPDAKKLVLMVALNIIQAGMAIVGYVTIFFLIKGGFGYITSAGSSDGMAAAKKTITNALIGLVIAILAASIVNAIAGVIK